MTITDRPATIRAPMDSLRKTALVAGAFYILTFVSIPSLALYSSVRAPNYILGAGPDTPVLVAAVLEIIVALAGIGTAVTLYPVLKRQNQGLALGLVGTRVLEAATIFAGVTALLAVVTLRQAGVGEAGLITGQALTAQYYWTFLFGQSFLPAANGVLLGTLMYTSRLVPRVLPILGFIGAGLLVMSWVGTMTGLLTQVSLVTGLFAMPIALWELSLGVYLLVKGFKPSPITAEMLADAHAAGRRTVLS